MNVCFKKCLFHETYSNNISGNGMAIHIKFVIMVSDIQLLPFDCINFNELVPTEP